MAYYLLRRLAIFVFSLLLASVVVFLVLSVLPGDPAQLILGVEATEESLETLRRDLGIDQPLWRQYLDWLGSMATGDFGTSYISGASIGPMIFERMQVTFPLALLAILVAMLLAAPAGMYAATRHRKLGDTVVSGLAQVGIAIPAFWAGIMLVAFFAVRLGWLPSGGFVPITASPLDWLRSLLLPAISLGVVQGAILTRYVRSAVLEVMREDFIRTARSKGLTRSQALWRHGLRNAAIPVLTILGLQFATLFAGTVVIENVFFLPGIGRMILQGINGRDLLLVQSTVIVLTAGILLINFLVDITYRLVDPRLKAAQ